MPYYTYVLGITPLFRIVDSPALIWSVVGFLVINVLLDFAETLQGFEVASLRDRMEGRVRSLIYEKVANFEDISLFEDPQRLNALQLAEQSIPRMQRLALIIGDLMTGFFVPALAISLSIAGWVPPLILDEPTAALDAKSEHEIFAAFREIARDKMAVVISHSLALARSADRIMVPQEAR
jgi:ATP-binding cassette subfamily B protein